MAAYTLNVLIDNAILALHSKDSLCIAKKVCFGTKGTLRGTHRS
jgi:hypothetical protein